MGLEMLQRDDLSVYIIAGVPKSFKKKLQKFVQVESKTEGDLMLMDDGMTDWAVARVRGDKRRNHQKTPASSALWRAYRALSAARYHLQDQALEGQVRLLRVQVEELWRDTSPLHEEEEEEGDGMEEVSASMNVD